MSFYLFMFVFVLMASTNAGRHYLLKILNTVYDRYLDFKYRNYNYRLAHLELCPYYLICLKIVNRKNRESSIVLRPQDVGLPENTDFSAKSYTIPVSTIVSKLGDLDPSDLVIYVYYKYNNQTYILPISTQRDQLVLPPYEFADLQTAMVTEYTQTRTDQVIDLRPFAGPKGNFYSDTTYPVRPVDLISDHTGQPVSQLDLTTTMGIDYTFKGDEVVKVDF